MIWTYWEQGLEQAPPWIHLGRETIERHAGGLEVVTLDRDSIRRYVPDVPEGLERIPSIATRADYLRVKLLHEHGGIWLDMDVVAFPALATLAGLLDEHELVSTGIVEHDITLAFLAARRGASLLGYWSELQERTIQDVGPDRLTGWAALGAPLIKEEVARLGYHTIDSARVYQLRWRQWRRLLSPLGDPDRLLADDPYVVCLFHHQMAPTLAGRSREQLVGGHSLLSQLYRRSLDLPDRRVDRVLSQLQPLDDAYRWVATRVESRRRTRRQRRAA